MPNLIIYVSVAIAIFLFGMIAMIIKAYKKVPQGKALVITGMGGLKVSFNGRLVFPIIHRMEVMDISVKNFTVSRTGKEGLVCQDNLRADIKVVFFIRVEPKEDSVKHVARTIGVERASDKELLVQLFDAKFSEALKTVGKGFDFVDLYDKRDDFKQKMVGIINKELNGYSLESVAIDYLEQTPLELLNADNILDAEGIKKISELTAEQHILSNEIRRKEEQTIKEQNVASQETILELDRQLKEKEENQREEIAKVKAQTDASIAQTESEQSKAAELARIEAEQEIQIAEQTKQKEVIIFEKTKEITLAKEEEKVTKARELEIIERDKAKALADISKKKEVEENLKSIQGVIKERISLEKQTVQEEEEKKNIAAFSEAERKKKVSITLAEEQAEQAFVDKIKSAEAEKKAAELDAEKEKIQAKTLEETSIQRANAKKTMADAEATEHASLGLAEAQVMEAKAEAHQKQGEAEANIIQSKAEAESEGIKLKQAAENEAFEERGKIEAKILEEKGLAEMRVAQQKAEITRQQGDAEAEVMQKKAEAEALQIAKKAEAMKLLDGVGINHEEFKLRLQQETELEKARIAVHQEIAKAQAMTLAEAFKASKIDIVGGETMFYQNIMGAISRGKTFDGFFNNSEVLSNLKDNLLNQNGGGNIIEKLRGYVNDFGISSEDLKNLTVSALIARMIGLADDDKTKGMLNGLLDFARSAGVAEKKANKVL